MVGEFALLAAIRDRLDGDGPGLRVGVDDDAAVIDLPGLVGSGGEPGLVGSGGEPGMVGSGATPGQLVLATDALVDGVHFDRGLATLGDVGWKALAVNVSDVAAVGGVPLAALVTLLRPPGFELDDALELYDGLREAAEEWGCRLVGGDTCSCPTLAVSVAVAGVLVDEEVVLRRRGARPGDLVAVVGELGLAAAGLRLHLAGERELLDAHPELVRAQCRPVALAEAAAPLVTAPVSACIDVSDGLGRDLGHVATASGVAVRLEAERLPVAPAVAAAAARLGVDPLDLVVGGGEDYALAVTIPPERLGRLDAALSTVGLSARVVGEVLEGSGVRLDGRDVSAAGWEHV